MTDRIDVYDGLLNAGWTENSEGHLRFGRALWSLLDDDGECTVAVGGAAHAPGWSVWFPAEVPDAIVLGVARAAIELAKAAGR
ncbi:hypothetical protein B4N89_27445 [Embleya scabrispora]|uniref:DUF317 domain-containing protein n=1 Tax=Embleya scabrispora TaxID=159449 RepID=A0A1T3P523_9ACTN|nr:hypothetical protein [Embleya scabrispora]OPC84163.1 hypothetical protein B4N89_27445 [Embleya scabrispora]